MLDTHFFHQLNRKYITLFGTIFNNINLIRYDRKTGKELKRIKVPIEFGPKEKYVRRLEGDPDLNRPVQIELPRMSFNRVSYTYDSPAAMNPLSREPKGRYYAAGVDGTYRGTPYILGFELYILASYTDDADQILEQILPLFKPDYTVTALPLKELGFPADIPIRLESVSEDTDWEGDFDTIRLITYTLSFTMKVNYYGPIENTKIIKKIHANTFIDPSLATGHIVRVNLKNGNNGTFKIEDTVFQGNSISTSIAAGTVIKWDANNKVLHIGGAQGDFKQNEVIHAATSNATYTLDTFVDTPLKIIHIEIEPDPVTAEPPDDYGYTTRITENPDGL